MIAKTMPQENSTRPPTRWPSLERWGLPETHPLLINGIKILVHSYTLRIPSSILCRYRPKDPPYLPAKVRRMPGKLLPHSTRRRGWPSPRKIVLTTCITKTYRPWNKCLKHRRSTRLSIINQSLIGPRGKRLRNQSFRILILTSAQACRFPTRGPLRLQTRRLTYLLTKVV